MIKNFRSQQNIYFCHHNQLYSADFIVNISQTKNYQDDIFGLENVKQGEFPRVPSLPGSKRAFVIGIRSIEKAHFYLIVSDDCFRFNIQHSIMMATKLLTTILMITLQQQVLGNFRGAVITWKPIPNTNGTEVSGRIVQLLFSAFVFILRD